MEALTRRSPKLSAAKALRLFTGWHILTAVAPAATTDLVELKLVLNRRNRKEKPTPYSHTIDDNRVFTNGVVALGRNGSGCGNGALAGQSATASGAAKYAEKSGPMACATIPKNHLHRW